MKALIFNSGLGKRMGELTKNNPKCMVKLYNGETIFERQIRILSECGINEFVITTGPFKEQLYEITKKFPNLKFIFVANDEYDKTNYIVSMDNAFEYLNDDFIMLHGDLVFDKALITNVMESKFASLCLINENKKLPEKDFKGRIQNGILKEVSINIFDDDCYAFQPLYKLDIDTLTKWKLKVREFVLNGITNVYAENALNTITDDLNINAMSYSNFYIDEIDNYDDYIRVSSEIKYYDYNEQEIDVGSIKKLEKKINNDEKLFVVCSDPFQKKISDLLKSFGNEFIIFDSFTANPKYEDILNGLELYKKNNCNTIIAIGGGSSIDVAKCIKAFTTMEQPIDFLQKKYQYSNTKIIAIPTTAGTGSESTKFAVMYYKGEKYSISHESLLPNCVILDKDLLKSLPEYQKKSTLIDALCQALESYWSKSSNLISKEYSKRAIDLILKNYEEYLFSEKDVYNEIMLAANYSGKAINITTTTLPHAMSYKISSLYNVAHGHAVGLCLPVVWKYMNENSDNKELKEVFLQLAHIMGKSTVDEAIEFIDNLYNEMNLDNPVINETDLDLLASSVNIERLNNNPIIYGKDEIYEIYKQISLKYNLSAKNK